MGVEERVVVFIGAYYKPNIEAAKFIIQKLAPQMKDVLFFIVGTVKDAFSSQTIAQNVRLPGWISDEDLQQLLRAADIALNPMFEGSGVNIKMLDCMAYGLPIVTTECGARGIEFSGYSPVIISKPDAFAKNINKLFADNVLRKRMGDDGRNLIARRYNWKDITKQLETVILERSSFCKGE